VSARFALEVMDSLKWPSGAGDSCACRGNRALWACLACRCPLAGAFFHGFSIPITDRIVRAAPADDRAQIVLRPNAR